MQGYGWFILGCVQAHVHVSAYYFYLLLEGYSLSFVSLVVWLVVFQEQIGKKGFQE